MINICFCFLGLYEWTCRESWWFSKCLASDEKWKFLWKIKKIHFICTQNRIGSKVKDAIRTRYGTDYTVGNIADTICMFESKWISILVCPNRTLDLKSFFADLASGSSIDWVYATQNVPLTYTFELRDKGNFAMNLVPLFSQMNDLSWFHFTQNYSKIKQVAMVSYCRVIKSYQTLWKFLTVSKRWWEKRKHSNTYKTMYGSTLIITMRHSIE